MTDEEIVFREFADLHRANHHQDYAGNVYTFSNPSLDERGNCAQQARAKQLSTAQVPITLRLLHQARDPDIHGIHRVDHEAVQQYLRDNLTWKAVDVCLQYLQMSQLSY